MGLYSRKDIKAYRLILSLMASVAAGPAFSQTTGVVCEEFDQIQLTHVLTPTGPLPTALDPNGVSPYMSYSETSNRPVPKRYRMISLENEKVKAIICPDLCGKVISLTHKESGKEVLYRPDGYYPVSISWPGGSRSVSRSPTLPRKMSRCFIRSIIRETAHM